jgi:hypothetical protein
MVTIAIVAALVYLAFQLSSGASYHRYRKAQGPRPNPSWLRFNAHRQIAGRGRAVRVGRRQVVRARSWAMLAPSAESYHGGAL